MSGERTPLSNGLIYGLASGVFAGSVWASIVSLPPQDTLIASRWILVIGGFLLSFLVGFLIGVFNAPRSVSEIAPPVRRGHSLAQRTLTGVGWFLYRLIVGYFVGTIATSLFALCGGAIWFAGIYLFFDLKKLPKDSPIMAAAFCSTMTSLFCGFTGAVFGALIGTRWSPSHRPAIGPRAFRGSFLAFLFGISFGAALHLPPGEEGSYVFVYFALSIPIGVLAGILGGLWTDVRKRSRDGNY